MPLTDLVGQRFGMLIVEGIGQYKRGEKSKSPARPYLWCLCDCGTRREVSASCLRAGATKSCGCNTARAIGDKLRSTAKTAHPVEWRIWNGMKTRCRHPDRPGNHRYSGRGITVCDRWLGSFEAFFEDMGSRPTSSHSIDRKDNDGNYEPDNCRWATPEEQTRNTSANHFITFNGRTMILSDWANEIGIGAGSLLHRIQKHGWSIEKALTTPAGASRRSGVERLETIDGRTMNLSEWSRFFGLNRSTLDHRLSKGWDIEKALKTPTNTRISRGYTRE